MDGCDNSKKNCIKDYKELIRLFEKYLKLPFHLYFDCLNNVFGTHWLKIKLNGRELDDALIHTIINLSKRSALCPSPHLISNFKGVFWGNTPERMNGRMKKEWEEKKNEINMGILWVQMRKTHALFKDGIRQAFPLSAMV